MCLFGVSDCDLLVVLLVNVMQVGESDTAD